MAGEPCARCGRAIPLVLRDWTSDLCGRCREELAKEQSLANLAALRGLEDDILLWMLSPVPNRWRPEIEGALSHARFRGLMKFLGGFILAVPAYLITYGIGRLTGYTFASALVGFPLAVSAVGLMEMVLGINFIELERRVSEGSIFTKVGISLVVLFFAGVYLAGGVWVYRRYFE